MFSRMGARNPTKTDICEHRFPVRLCVEAPDGYGNPVERALRRVTGGQPYGRIGRHLYLSRLAHAAGFVCACPAATLYGEWPLRIVLAFEVTQEMLIRDALRPVVGDMGYVLERVGRERAGRPGWHLHMRCVWDAVQFMRARHPGLIVGDRWRDRNE
jgi:hypothetical protein